MVLLLPWILAMLGDNPMQSEFASHIGLTGKCFCRVCNVKGADTKNRPPGDEGERQRVADFLQTADLRTKEGTLKALKEQLEDHLRGEPSAASTKATATGVKDRYFQYFADQLATTCAEIKEQQQRDPSLKGNDHLKKVLGDLRATMPTDNTIFSPSLRLDDFDPNSDSPVEIFHVILLGFPKVGKDILKARINSFDAAALGLAAPRGNTLVQYAGSLTGRDFRLVVQIAPAVLYGMIPDETYEAWLNLRVFQLCDSCQKCAFKPTGSSIDIGNAFNHMHAVRHLISGGWIVQDCSDPQNPVVRQAGSGILALLKEKTFLRLMGMTDFFASCNYGKYTVDLKVEPMRDWALTKSARFAVLIPRQCTTDSILRSCSRVVLANGDMARPWMEVTIMSGERFRQVSNHIANSYQHPFILKDCLASVRTIHNCASHNCPVTTTREIIQERRKTGRFDNEVTHTPDTSDLILNLAQLRSARYLQNSSHPPEITAAIPAVQNSEPVPTHPQIFPISPTIARFPAQLSTPAAPVSLQSSGATRKRKRTETVPAGSTTPVNAAPPLARRRRRTAAQPQNELTGTSTNVRLTLRIPPLASVVNCSHMAHDNPHGSNTNEARQ
ncbi:hypothetical protein K438DRAFT_1767117 [Mycena galopus ATCC 62051]|nr:hypothetical protein K438DRAFT_1767117 [Mycena galopus ATCC 62051]